MEILQTKKDACLREIQAGNILLKNATKWNLTEKEIEDTKTLIEIYTNKLNKLEIRQLIKMVQCMKYIVLNIYAVAVLLKR